MRHHLRNARSQELGLGDLVILRKRHPCGGDRWRVWKLGMDIGLQCEMCGRKVRFSRLDLDRQIRQILGSHAPGA